ncbi:alpha/beta fold hydrolase [Desulfobotulus sp. H1]|uniref:Alpha/beta fold hydrolase n=1 Tax=Desulfobotulus pelophilus TaxID=2823377 RepID=A0ABT3N7A3_9BACT|nr:alpha/beta fold hydrolase [Desulfobotulus pelophilus]MCW7753333.1 alpha/beta fold hydrolase [Desulfobotulus pelophilus]
MQTMSHELKRIYPFRSRAVSVNGFSMHYIDEGSGPVVLCLHGNPTWSFYYRHVVQTLSPMYRVLVPDHIGMGLSDKPHPEDHEHSLMQRVRDTETFLDAVAPEEPVHLIVHDWGGMIGTLLALRRPERIKSFVITNTAGFLQPAEKQLPLRIRLARDVRPLAVPAILGMNLFSKCALLFCSVRKLSSTVQEGYLFPYRRPVHRRAQLAFVQDIPLTPGDRSYEAVAWAEKNLSILTPLPKIILWGEKDFVFDTDYRDRWQHCFPDAACHSFPNAGHYLFEDERERCMILLRAFLEQKN